MSRQSIFMLRQSLIKAMSFYVAIEYSCVANRVWPWMGFLCRNKVLLRRERKF